MLEISNQSTTATVRTRILTVLLALATLSPSVAAQFRQSITGKVVTVIDGDSITVLDAAKRQHEVRIDGIDAPETDQAFGDRAKKSLAELILGKTVTVTGAKINRRGHLVGRVTLHDKDIGLKQIERGMAWYFRKYADDLSREDAQAYELAEAGARAKSRGLWSSPGPIPPWELRAAHLGQLDEWELEAVNGEIIGNRSSSVYQRPDCPDYKKVSEDNRIYFKSEKEATAAGYKKAVNCP
jgi:endonuclease YncB( thermonuclease family)